VECALAHWTRAHTRPRTQQNQKRQRPAGAPTAAARSRLDLPPQHNTQKLHSLSEPSTVEALLHYLVDDVPADSLADPKRAYKFPFAACEVLCCELDAVFDALVAEERLLDLLFSPLKRPPPLSPRAAGYLGRVVGSLLLRKTGEMMQYLSFRGESLVCKGMVRHAGSASVADVLRRLAGADDQSAVLFMPVHTQWLAETPLVEALLARMAYTGEAEVEEEKRKQRSSGGGGSGGEGEDAGAGADASADESGAAVYDAAYCAEARANAADILTAIAHTQPSALAAKLSRPECVSLLLGRVLPLAPGEAAPGGGGGESAAAGGEAAAADEAAAAPAAPAAAAEATAARTTARAGGEKQEEAEQRPAAAAAPTVAPPLQHPDELLPALEVCSALLEPRRSQMVIGGGPDGMGGGDYGLLGGGMLGDEPMMMEGGGGVVGGVEGGAAEGGGGAGGGGDTGGPGPDTLAAVLAYVPALVRFLTDYGGGVAGGGGDCAGKEQQEAGSGSANGGGAASTAAASSSSPAKKPVAAAAAAAAGVDAQPAKDSDAEAGDEEDDDSSDEEDDEGDSSSSKGEAAAAATAGKAKKKKKTKKAASGENADDNEQQQEDPTYPDPAFVQETTYGLLRPPLGRARLRAVELLAAILRAGGPPAAEALAEAGAVRALMRLFEAYPFHNLLHHAFGSVVLAALARGGDGAARHLLGDPCRLPEWLARLPREVWPQLRPGQEPAQRPLRAGYLGHVTQVGNILLDAAAASPAAAALLAESAEWSSFVAGELAAANAAEDVGAWECGRPSSVEIGPLDGEGGMAAMMMAGMAGDAFGAAGADLERLAAAAAAAGAGGVEGGLGGGGSGGGSALYHRYGVLEEEEEEEEEEDEVEGGGAGAGAGGGAVAAEDDEAGEAAARALQGLSVAEAADAPEGATPASASASAASDDDAVLLASDNEGEEGGEGGGAAGGGGGGSSAPAAAGSPSPPPPAAAASSSAAAATAATA
jgi:hypothetical protein